jgi:neutral ceramidase
MTLQMPFSKAGYLAPTSMVSALLLFAVLRSAEAENAPAAQPAPLKVGFARTDVTPAVGMEIPGGFAKNFSKGVHDPLWAEAAFFNNGTTRLAVVGVDLITVPVPIVREARKQAEARCGIPAANILIGASHTHNGGPVDDCWYVESDAAYCKFAAGRIADAVVKAAESAVEARISCGLGREDGVGYNRRFRMKDGTIRTHPGKMNPDIVAPAGPIDPDVAVIAAEDLKGRLLGCIVNFALHGTTLSGSLVSADWTFYLRQTIRGGLGSDIGVVFLNGACGDVTQVDNRNPRPGEFGETWARRVGMSVGAVALNLLAKAEFTLDARLGVMSETLALPIRDLGTSDAELVKREAPGIGLGTGDEIYLKEAARIRAMKAQSPTAAIEVQVMRIGPAGIAGNPAELFCQLGLDIKRGSPWKPTMVVELANGCCGYVATSEAYLGGGYEVRTARCSYLAPGTGEQIANASARLLCRLAGK